MLVLIGVGNNLNYIPFWQSPDLPSPTILTAPNKKGGAGWLLFEERENDEEFQEYIKASNTRADTI